MHPKRPFFHNNTGDLMSTDTSSSTAERGYLRALLVLPFIALLWVPFYNDELPALFGFPFFYWYQLAWVPLTALIIWIVYKDGLKRGVE
jgi:hypothetical protein